MVECKSENVKYSCKTIADGYVIESDATPDKGGLGNGIRPHDILASAFASCLNMSVRMACDRKGIAVDHVTTIVNLIREEDKTTFAYRIEFSSTIAEDVKNDIIKMVENCPVRKTLSKPIGFQLM